MIPVQQTTSNPGGTENAAHLLIAANATKATVDDPELLMEQMWMRATQVSTVLEEILREPHGVPRWGLNE